MDVKDLMDSWDNWYKARRALEVAEASCEYDRDYFLHREYEEVGEAEAKLAAALNAWIDQRLAAHNAKGGV